MCVQQNISSSISFFCLLFVHVVRFMCVCVYFTLLSCAPFILHLVLYFYSFLFIIHTYRRTYTLTHKHIDTQQAWTIQKSSSLSISIIFWLREPTSIHYVHIPYKYNQNLICVCFIPRTIITKE